MYSRYKKQRILYHIFKGLKAPTIAKILVEEERLGITMQGAHSFHCETRMADGQAMRPSVISEDVKEIVEAQIQACFEF